MFFIKNFNYFFISLIILIFIISIFSVQSNCNPETKIIDFIDDGNLLWPAPNYYGINSYFGKRNAPTGGASTYHKGIDIAVPQGKEFIAVTDGTITFRDFLGGGGYTITLTDSQGVKYSYCHSDPNFVVSVGDNVKKGQIIGNVGPKYVYGVIGNKYHDSKGIPTNGATTGPHLHFRNENK